MKNLIVILLLFICSTIFAQNNPPIIFGSIKDIDGNSYQTVMIGSKMWMAENLRVIHFNDGTAIPKATGTKFPEVYTPQCGAYDNYYSHGVYYNWYCVSTGKLCPTGWSIPTTTDWQNLATALGGQSVAAKALKTNVGWNGTNSSGFNGLAAGYAVELYMGDNGDWWSAIETAVVDPTNTTSAYYGRIYTAGSELQIPFLMKQYGISVRCVK